MRLEQLGNRRVFLLQADVGARHADLGEAGADRVLAGEEGGAAGGAALLAVVVGEGNALVADAVDVGRAVAHLAAAVVADVPPADVVAPQDEDVRLLGLSSVLSPSLRLPLIECYGSVRSVAETRQKKAKMPTSSSTSDHADDGRVAAFLGHSGDRRIVLAPQVLDGPAILPHGDQQRGDAAEDQRQAEVARRVGKGRRGGCPACPACARRTARW